METRWFKYLLNLLLFFHLFLARTLKSNFPNIFFCLPEKIKNVIFGSSHTTLKSKWINCFSLQRSEGTSRQVIGEIRRRHKFNFQFNLVKCVNNLGYCVSKLVLKVTMRKRNLHLESQTWKIQIKAMKLVRWSQPEQVNWRI